MSSDLLKTILEAGGLGVAVLVIFLFYRLASDHIRRNTDSQQKLTYHISENTKETIASRSVLNEIKIFLIKANGKK